MTHNFYTPEKVAVAVCAVMGGRPEVVFQNHRGTPHEAMLRWLSMHVWRTVNGHPSYTATGAAFGRDRRNVARGLRHLVSMGVLSGGRFTRILERVHEDG